MLSPAISSVIRNVITPSIGLGGAGAAPSLADTLVPLDVTTWNANGASTTVTDNGDESYRAQMPVGAATFIAHAFTAQDAGTTLRLSFQIRSRTTSYDVDYAVADDAAGTNGVISGSVAVTTAWQTVWVTGDCLASTDTLVVSDDSIDDADIDIRNIQLVVVPVPEPAGFPDPWTDSFTWDDSLTWSEN